MGHADPGGGRRGSGGGREDGWDTRPTTSDAREGRAYKIFWAAAVKLFEGSSPLPSVFVSACVAKSTLQERRRSLSRGRGRNAQEQGARDVAGGGKGEVGEGLTREGKEAEMTRLPVSTRGKGGA